MTVKPIKIEIVTNYLSDIEKIVEAVRKLRKSNPDETLEVTVRVEKFGDVKNIVHPWLDDETNAEDFAEKISHQIRQLFLAN